MIGRKRDPDIGQADFVSQEIEERRQLTVGGQHHGPHFRRIRPHLVPKNVVGREADHKQIGGRAIAHAFVRDQLAGEVKFVVVGERSCTNQFVENRVFSFKRVSWSAKRGRPLSFHSRFKYFSARLPSLKSCTHLGRSLR